jgi:type II pantothenate kinase
MSADTPQTDKLTRVQSHDGPAGPSSGSKPLRMRTNTAEIDSTITHPGSVKINVQGAFIVDQDAASPNGSVASTNGGNHDTKDIRLPNHTAVVSHIAVDVCFSPSSQIPASLMAMADWRLSSQTCLFLQRTQVPRARRPPELHELRDRPNR